MLDLLLPIALQADSAARDPTWAQTRGWIIRRANGGACDGDTADSGGSTQLLRVTRDGERQFAVRNPAWTPGRYTLFAPKTPMRPEAIAVAAEVRDGPLGRGLYVTDAGLGALSSSSLVSLYSGTNTRGVPLILAGFGQVEDGFAAAEHCAKALVAEQAAHPPVSGDAPRQLVYPAIITSADYPMAMLRKAASGTVTYRLDVDETGYPTACSILASSGEAMLDDATCKLLRWRARYVPRVDAAGKPVRDAFQARFAWTIPND